MTEVCLWSDKRPHPHFVSTFDGVLVERPDLSFIEVVAETLRRLQPTTTSTRNSKADNTQLGASLGVRFTSTEE